MPADQNRVRRPDRYSITLPFVGLGGTYYTNPGSPTAPSFTLTGGLGMGGGGAHAVYLRDGMTSNDTLGWGASAQLSAVGPSAVINGSIPDWHGIPLPWKSKVSSIEGGVGIPGFGVSVTATPQQIADAVITPAGGPNDELDPYFRRVQSGNGTVGQNEQMPIRYLGRRVQSPVGEGMTPWSSSVDANAPSYVAPPSAPSSPASPDEPGGLLGMLRDYMRNNPNL